MPMRMLVPPLRRLDERLRSAHALECRRAIGHDDRVRSRMQADEDGVGLQRQRIGDDVEPDGK